MVQSIKSVLMKRGITAADADDQIKEARADLVAHIAAGNMSAADNVCKDHFGLEPDYLDELTPAPADMPPDDPQPYNHGSGTYKGKDFTPAARDICDADLLPATEAPVKQLKRLCKLINKQKDDRPALQHILIEKNHFIVTNGRGLIIERHGHNLDAPLLVHKDQIKLLDSKTAAIATDKKAGTLTDCNITIKNDDMPADHYPKYKQVCPEKLPDHLCIAFSIENLKLLIDALPPDAVPVFHFDKDPHKAVIITSQKSGDIYALMLPCRINK